MEYSASNKNIINFFINLEKSGHKIRFKKILDKVFYIALLRLEDKYGLTYGENKYFQGEFGNVYSLSENMLKVTTHVCMSVNGAKYLDGSGHLDTYFDKLLRKHRAGEFNITRTWTQFLSELVDDEVEIDKDTKDFIRFMAGVR